MKTELKVRNLSGDTYQVIEFTLSDDEQYKYEDEQSIYQGSLSDCEAYIRLTLSNLMI